MTYRVKVLGKEQSLALGITGFRKSQEYARRASEQLMEDLLVVNEQDDEILCMVVYNRGGPYLTLTTSGAKDVDIKKEQRDTITTIQEQAYELDSIIVDIKRVSLALRNIKPIEG